MIFSFPIALIALCFALMGLAAFAKPQNVVAILGLPADTPDARNEVQAVYGGFGLAVAATLLATMWYPDIRDGVVIAVAASLAGMAAGRVVAALRERPGKWPALFFVIEASGAAFLLSAL